MESLTPQQFIFETPLYHDISWTGKESNDLIDIIYHSGTIDGPCLACRKETTYRRADKVIVRNYAPEAAQLSYHRINYACSRDDRHKVVIFINVSLSEKVFRKIGQFPSLASLHGGKLNMYRKVLDDEKFLELSKGFGLASHGVGIGSFVYLRRVFEYLLEEAHQAKLLEPEWNESSYQKARVGEKIRLLKSILPSFLVDHAVLYKILSKGLHELSEDECLKVFPVVTVGIELILDEKIRIRDNDLKIQNAKKTISELASQI